MKIRHRIRWLGDSYYHYRRHVGLSRMRSIWRALYFEIMGRDPYIYLKEAPHGVDGASEGRNSPTG